MSEDKTKIIADKVATALTERYYRLIILPYLLKYKKVVQDTLLEEEKLEGLEEIYRFLLNESSEGDLYIGRVLH